MLALLHITGILSARHWEFDENVEETTLSLFELK